MNGSALIARQLGELQQNGSALPAPDAVHELRVSVRRLRAVLRIVRLRNLDPDAKALQDALGEVRDLQLESAWVRGRDARLARACHARLRKAERALDGALERWRTRGLPALLEEGASARAPGRSKVKKIVRKRLRRMKERLEAARVQPRPASLHRARISVKQIRYLLEAAGELLPKKAAHLIADLKTLQASLGQLHDVDVRIGLLRQLPLLLREQREERERLAKIVAAQLSRWRKQKVAARAIARLR